MNTQQTTIDPELKNLISDIAETKKEASALDHMIAELERAVMTAAEDMHSAHVDLAHEAKVMMDGLEHAALDLK